MNRFLGSTIATLIAASLIPSMATADEAAVRKMMDGKVGKIERVVKSQIVGIWEISADGQVFYADDAGKYILFGSLIEGKSGKNLTSEASARQWQADAGDI